VPIYRSVQRNKSETFVALSTDNKNYRCYHKKIKTFTALPCLALPCQIRGAKQDVLSVRGTLRCMWFELLLDYCEDGGNKLHLIISHN